MIQVLPHSIFFNGRLFVILVFGTVEERTTQFSEAIMIGIDESHKHEVRSFCNSILLTQFLHIHQAQTTPDINFTFSCKTSFSALMLENTIIEAFFGLPKILFK